MIYNFKRKVNPHTRGPAFFLVGGGAADRPTQFRNKLGKPYYLRFPRCWCLKSFETEYSFNPMEWHTYEAQGMSRCLKYRVKEAFCAVQGLRVLGGRQAGKPPTAKRTALKFRTKCSRHGPAGGTQTSVHMGVCRMTEWMSWMKSVN